MWQIRAVVLSTGVLACFWASLSFCRPLFTLGTSPEKPRLLSLAPGNESIKDTHFGSWTDVAWTWVSGAGSSSSSNSSSRRLRSHRGKVAVAMDPHSSATVVARNLTATKVWLYVCRSDYARGLRLYDVMIKSLQESLTDLGATVVVSHWPHSATLVRDVKDAVGKVSPWVVALGWFKNSQESKLALKQVADLGARVVLYQTEPEWTVLRSVRRVVAEVGAQEVWDYSRSNLDALHKIHVPKRFVPPGYVRALDFGIDPNSRTANFSAVGFMGQNRGPRVEPYQRIFGKDLVARRVFEASAYKDFLSEVPLQLNLHRGKALAMEATRMALLLSNKACVVSAPVEKADMETWQGLVHFATTDSVAEVVGELRKDIAGCRMRSHQEYLARFTGKSILERAGIPDMMRALERKLL